MHEAVFDSLEHGTAHGSTFAPNDLAMAAGLATLHELADKGLVEHSARMGELLLELTRPLAERFEAVKEVRGLGLLWAIEFDEPASRQRSWRLLERIQPGFFSQLVIGPLFSKHHVLAQVAGHHMNVIKAIPPLVVTESDVEWFADALEQAIAKAERIPRATLRLRGPRRDARLAVARRLPAEPADGHDEADEAPARDHGDRAAARPRSASRSGARRASAA